MIKVGLSGGLFTGYEYVAQIFEKYGVPVFDADVALKFILNYRDDIARRIRIEFGIDIYKSGLIDGRKLNTTQKFDKLIDIAELEIIRMYETFRFANKDAAYTIFKSGILYERQLEKSMDYNITVFRPKQDRIHDMKTETGMRLTEVHDLLKSEMEPLNKNNSASWTIHNYWTISNSPRRKVGDGMDLNSNDTLDEQVLSIHKKIESKSINNLLINKFDDSLLYKNITY